MRTCNNCGKEIANDKLKFCPNCGKPLLSNNENTFIPFLADTSKYSILLYSQNSLAWFNISIGNTKEKDSSSEVCCQICFGDISKEDFEKVKLKCGHIFCPDCYYEFLKEKINNNNLKAIKCMQFDCPEKLSEDFIRKMISKDQNLLESLQEKKLAKSLSAW